MSIFFSIKEDSFMVKGLHICKKGRYLESYGQSAGELQLLGRGDGAEVMIQNIIANKPVFVEPGDNIEIMEFFYIIEGEVEFADSKERLTKGDYFFSHLLTKPVELRTLTNVELLYFTTQPIFHNLSTTIRQLMELSDQVQEKDSYTHSHTNNVKEYALKIGNKLRLSKEKIENIGLAAMLHDIGKIEVPDYILNTPGKLTEEEFDIIKKHPVIGAELVKETYYENLSDIILQHHERIDGSGYPSGLKGNEILIEAKVVAMADVYHAMITDRPYRKGLKYSEIIKELKELSGIKYDKEIVDALLDIMKEEREEE